MNGGEGIDKVVETELVRKSSFYVNTEYTESTEGDRGGQRGTED